MLLVGGAGVDQGVEGRMLSSQRWDGYQERRTAKLIVVVVVWERDVGREEGRKEKE